MCCERNLQTRREFVEVWTPYLRVLRMRDKRAVSLGWPIESGEPLKMQTNAM
jgi:hypothetical protein